MAVLQMFGDSALVEPVEAKVVVCQGEGKLGAKLPTQPCILAKNTWKFLVKEFGE